ncbi:MAG: ribonuclease P protein component [Arcobacteraceae bacterium]|nr:ribonuclease P protein component [Arcobacteraceae bacterium]
MSCLNKQHRVKSTKEFNQIYKSNIKWHTNTFVAFFKSSNHTKIGFVASKKVGNAVARNRAKRLLRSLMLKNELNLPAGEFVFVAKEEILKREYPLLEKDFKYAMKKMGIFKVAVE